MFKSFLLLLVFTVCRVYCNIESSCSQKEVWSSYLDVAMNMISEAKYNIHMCNTCYGNCLQKARDCTDVLHMGHNKSGIYEIWPMNRIMEEKPISVYCDMDTDCGGWTVIQRRGDFKRAIDYFYKDWKSYKEGFGNLRKDFWLGNDNIYSLTNQKLYSARFDLMDASGYYSYALYDTFWIDNEDQKYRLYISDYSGQAGDSMKPHNSSMFSTKDQDNDNKKNSSCANTYKGGWWYDKCHLANLNGLYYKGMHESFAKGVNWYTWRNYHNSLEWTEIKIRQKNFKACDELESKAEQ